MPDLKVFQIGKRIAKFEPGTFDVEITDCEGGTITVTVMKPSKTRKFVAKQYECAELTRKIQAHEGDPLELQDQAIDIFCEVFLVSWTLTDDDGNPVPIEWASEILSSSDAGAHILWAIEQAWQKEVAKLGVALPVIEGPDD